MEEQEYIVILKNHDYLDQFYEDMESSYGDNEIPNRVIECAYRRPTSRSTHYYITLEEALRIAEDSRVEAIELNYRDKGLKIGPLIKQSSNNWNKALDLDPVANKNDINWGLLRSFNKVTTPGWGWNGTPSTTGTINLHVTGTNVDIVIVDGHMIPGHPEWAVNFNGTGGTRFVQYNWFQHNAEVMGAGTPSGNYVYDFPIGTDGDHDHGCHVASTAAGSQCGWAKTANIYNICPYPGSTRNAIGKPNYSYDVLNYIKAWHTNKPINPTTGRKNPTIINCSWGGWGVVDPNATNSIWFRNVLHTKPAGTSWTNTQLLKFGLILSDGIYQYFHQPDASIDADVQDLVNSGIIVVGAAGNAYGLNAASNHINYNDAIGLNILGLFDIPYYYYHRGPSPGTSPGAICVSCVDHTVAEQKADFSNAGTRTDIFSPGSAIMAASYSGGIPDPRNSNFKRMKMSGTSMASPQVCGVIACELERSPNMTPTQARDYIRSISTKNQLSTEVFDSAKPNDWFKLNSCYGGPNMYLAYLADAVNATNSGVSFPITNYKARGVLGQTWPRVKTINKRV